MQHTSPARYEQIPAGQGGSQWAYMNYYWDPLNSGDCHLKDGKLSVRSDGQATFTASMWTDHSTFGDHWHSAFWFNDPSGRQFLLFGPSSGPGTTGSQVQISFSFSFHSDLFSKLPTDLGRVIHEYHC